MRSQLLCHILVYGEMLLAWQLPEKRGELLKLVEDDIQGLPLDNVVSDETLYSGQIGGLQCIEINIHIIDQFIHRLHATMPELWVTK